MSGTTLPNEYAPIVLTPRQQEIHRRYTALGFKIAQRPFAGRDENLYFFLDLPSSDSWKGIQFTINLHSGILHQTGTHQVWKVDEAEAAFGERTAVSPPSAPEVKAAPVPPPAELQQPKANPLGGLTPSRSPEKPTRKKQTSLF